MNKIVLNRRRRSYSYCPDIKEETSKKEKVKNFEMLNYDDYNKIFDYDYSVVQLKNIARFHKIKISGTKQQLNNRIYNFLHQSYHIIKIQKAFRKKIVRLWKFYKGPALIKRNLCVNEYDSISLEKIKTMSVEQIITFSENDYIYGFDIMSLNELFKTNNINEHSNSTTLKNPFTNNKLSSLLPPYIKRIIQLQKCLHLDTNLDYDINDFENQDIYSDESINHKIVDIFTKIDLLGNYSDINWFSHLSYHRLVRYLRELYDIWNYRAQLTDDIKKNICHPSGNPFNTSINTIITHDNLNYIRYQTLEIMNNFLTKGIDLDNKKTGAFYVLAALTLVNHNAAFSLPWLYESVSHMQN